MTGPDSSIAVSNRARAVALLAAEAVALVLGADALAALVAIPAGLSSPGGERAASEGILLAGDVAAGGCLLALTGWRARAVFGPGWPATLGLTSSRLRGGVLVLLLAGVLAADILWSGAVAILLEPLAPEAESAPPAPAGSGERLLWLARMVIVAPFVEELFFRGYLQARAGLVLSPAAGVVLVALLFALAHVGGRDLLHPVATLSSGLLWALVRRWTGSLWPCLALHATFNAFVALTEIAAS